MFTKEFRCFCKSLFTKPVHFPEGLRREDADGSEYHFCCRKRRQPGCFVPGGGDHRIIES